MYKKFLTFITIVLFLAVNNSCSTKSIFPIESDQKKDNIFQYCGGQQWGYLENLNLEKDFETYLAVYLESNTLEKSDIITLSFAIQVKSDISFSSTAKQFKVYLDNHEISIQPSNFWIARSEKRIWQRYSSNYSYRKIGNSENTWEVRKQKYGGLFGNFALDEPFLIKINTYPNEEIKENSIKVSFDNENDVAIYILNKLIIPLDSNKSKKSLISVKIPDFEINGIRFPGSQYKFHYDRENLIKEIPNSNRCASLEEIFRDGKNKNSWIWWMYPKISD